MKAIAAIKKHQRYWADSKGIKYDKVLRVSNLTDNFYQPLTDDTECELREGAGDEFGQPDKPGKIHSLYSSAALVCNVFDYWRSRNGTAAIAGLCGAEGKMTSMTFEKTHKTPLRGTPPHLDLEFRAKGGRLLAIESKFTEPYSTRRKHCIEDPYVDTPNLWQHLPACGELAAAIHSGAEKFFRLDAPQLLKHILGLTSSPQKERFTLLYLSYDSCGDEAEEHKKEIDRFLKLLRGEVNLRTMIYQELFKKIKNYGSAESSYIAYLEERYFRE